MHEELPDLLTLLNFVRQTPGSAHKVFCQFATVSPALARRVAQAVGLAVEGFAFTLDSYGMRHALNGHSKERGSQDRLALTGTDFLELSTWLEAPDAIVAGVPGKHFSEPERLLFERLDPALACKTVAVLERRPRWKRLVLVTLYKTKTG